MKLDDLVPGGIASPFGRNAARLMLDEECGMNDDKQVGA